MIGRIALRRAINAFAASEDLGYEVVSPIYRDGIIFLDRIVQEGKLVDALLVAEPCQSCGRRPGLDESKLPYVPGYLHKGAQRALTSTITVGFGTSDQHDVHVRPSVSRTGNEYAIRQLIAKSGLYTQTQLRESKIPFNQHELEISDWSFEHNRTFKCSCGIGSWDDPEFNKIFSEEGLKMLGENPSRPVSPDTAEAQATANMWSTTPVPYQMGYPPQVIEDEVRRRFDEEWGGFRNGKPVPRPLQGAEEAFTLGKAFRTGYRVRSPAARKRRKEKGKKPFLVSRVVKPEPLTCALGTGLFTVNPSPIVLEFKISDCLYSQRKSRRKAWIKHQHSRNVEATGRKDLLCRPDGRFSKKDYYFLRKNGMAYHSVHNPDKPFWDGLPGVNRGKLRLDNQPAG